MYFIIQNMIMSYLQEILCIIYHFMHGSVL